MQRPNTEDLARLTDIVAYGERAIRHLGGQTYGEFIADEKTFDGVVRCLHVLGEAAWKVSKEMQAARPDVPWIKLAGMRHRLVHDYGEVEPAIAYSAVVQHLPGLVAQVRGLLTELEET